MLTFPASTDPGPMCAKSPIIHSCSIIAPVFIIHPSFITLSEFIEVFFETKFPLPNITSLLISEEG